MPNSKEDSNLQAFKDVLQVVRDLLLITVLLSLIITGLQLRKATVHWRKQIMHNIEAPATPTPSQTETAGE